MSEREIEVLRLMATGFDNNQIAAELNISAKTVKNHISSIFAKLEMNNRVQAAVYAVRSGLA
jgi:DNA-binding NarL/FixJ family response regulator